MAVRPARNDRTAGTSFGAVRLLAVLVLFWYHQVAILNDPAALLQLADGLPLGTAAIVAMFAIGGHLVAASMCRDGDAGRLLGARALRLFPGLLACLAFCVVLGAVVSELTLGDYLGDGGPARFLVANAALFVSETQLELPGVFRDSVSPVVNLPLGVLRYTLIFSAVIVALAAVPLTDRGRRTAVLVLMALALVLCLTVAPGITTDRYTGFDVGVAAQLGLAAAIGAALAFAPSLSAGRTGTVLPVAGLAAALLAAVDLPARIDATLAIVAVTCLTLTLAARRSPGRFVPAPVAGLAYGIFLYGFVAQQLVLTETGLPDAWTAALSFGLTVALAAASWFLVERPALQGRRPRLGARVVARWPRVAALQDRTHGAAAYLAGAAALTAVVPLVDTDAARMTIGAACLAIAVVAVAGLVLRRRRANGRLVIEPPVLVVLALAGWHFAFWPMYFLGLAEDFRADFFLSFTPDATGAAFLACTVAVLAAAGGVLLGTGDARAAEPRDTVAQRRLLALPVLGLVLVLAYFAVRGHELVGDYAAIFTREDGPRRLYNLGVVLVLGAIGPICVVEHRRRVLAAFALGVVLPTCVIAALLGSRWVVFSAIAVALAALSLRRLRLTPAVVVAVVAGVALLGPASTVLKVARAGDLRSVADVPEVAFGGQNPNAILDLPQELGQTFNTVAGTIADIRRPEYAVAHRDLELGETLVAPLVTVVPSGERLLGVDVPRPSDDFAAVHFARRHASEGYTMGFSPVAELYLNFGVLGVLLGGALAGYGLGRLYRAAAASPRDAVMFALWAIAAFAVFGMRNDVATWARYAVWGAVIFYAAGRPALPRVRPLRGWVASARGRT